MPYLGLQLYTIREACNKDIEAAIQAVAAIGYRYVELAGFGGLDAKEMRRLLERTGLKAISAHVPMEAIRRDFPGTARDLRELGCHYVTVPSPPANVGDEAGDWRFFREELRFYADQFAHAGLTLAYHNHGREFEPLRDGKRPIDLLFEQVEPYELQLDVYWAQYAGVDPANYLAKFPGKCSMIHVKDLAPSPDRRDTIVGSGILNWPHILSVAGERGVKYFIVEVDNPGDGAMELIAQGYGYLRQSFPAFFADEC